MEYPTDIEKIVTPFINSNFHIKLDATTYKKHINSYECMLLSFLSLSRECIKNELRNPAIVVFDYQERIICNRYFNIEYVENHSDDSTNFRLELIEDTRNDRIYFMLQEKAKPDNVVFHWLHYSIPFNTLSHVDYSKIVDYIIDRQQLKKDHEVLNFELLLHRISFETGDWHIKKP
ncbi:hypothetical protein [Aquimarina sp. I32.4]|uniref:hypothetical protein n=1 Tax=Aquimarina sp. I32.4 TaxID=2053903 RepID=UPI000CDEB1C1|nr:hypothetical protein [Aquimarina sp. I32.4]